MPLRFELTQDRVVFPIQISKQKLTLPLTLSNSMIRKLSAANVWDEMILLDDLWVRGIVDCDEPGTAYIVFKNINRLDNEQMRQLNLPVLSPDIIIQVSGNLVSPELVTKWYPVINGRKWGYYQKYGPFVRLGDSDFILTEEQQKAIMLIEENRKCDGQIERAKQLDALKRICKAPNITMDSFVASEDFVFPESVGFKITGGDAQCLNLKPILDGLNENLQALMPTNISDRIAVSDAGRHTYVYNSEKIQSTFYSVPREIKGKDVPAFLDNPLAYLPENVVFDEAEFSKRVKGLKVARSTAMPYVRLEKADKDGDWFDFDFGVSLLTKDDEQTEFESTHLADYGRTLSSEEYKMLVDRAIENEEEFVYYNDMWIKLDPQAGKDFLAKCNQAEHQLESGRISKKKARLVLDIFENLIGVEYSEDFLLEIERSQDTVDFIPPSLLKAVLRPYQHQGYNFLRDKYEHHIGALIADDMGLGKTIQVIAYLAFLMENGSLKPSLIVLPSALTDNWVREFTKFLPALDQKEIYVHQGANRLKNAISISSFSVVLTTYETLARDQITLGKIHWSAIVCDEAQKIKNYRTQAACAAKGMKSNMRMALTGTPVENRLAELWSIVDFVQPGLLKSYSWFSKEYEKPIQDDTENSVSISEELVQHIKPVFLRRVKEDVLAGELPLLSEYRCPVVFSQTQSELYAAAIEKYKSEKGMALACIQQLITICSHPRLVINPIMDTEVLLDESPKLRETISILRKIKEKGEKAIVFTKIRKMQSILRLIIFQVLGVNAQIINGEIHEGRLQIIDNFSRISGFNVLILSPRAAGVGLNIVEANHVIHYTREWNPAIERQATDRVYRIGQKRSVSVYYPICVSQNFTTAEVRLNELLEKKTELMKRVVIPSNLEIRVSEMSDILQ